MNLVKLILIVIIIITYSCNTEQENKISTPKSNNKFKGITQQESINISRFWTSDEAYKIKKFVERNNWDALKSETGLYYYIKRKNPDGKKAKAGDIAVIDYKIRLIDADTTLCYKSEFNKPQEILIEMDNVESGLHEALTYLREGEFAYIILPHYLAHGLAGDLDKIPPLSPVLYELNLIKLK